MGAGSFDYAPTRSAQDEAVLPLPLRERKFAVSFEQLSVISAKAVALGETGGDDTARLGARADPIVERRLGAYAVLSLAPAQPIGEAEDFGVGEAAILVAL